MFTSGKQEWRAPIFAAVVLLLLYLPEPRVGAEDARSDGLTEETCKLEGDGSVTCDPAVAGVQLTRLPPVKIGHKEKIQLQEPARELTMTTLSLKPVIFEIPNFLTSDECDHFIQAAKKQGLQQSVTHQNIQSRSKNFRIYDLNKDKKLSVREMMVTIENEFDVYPDEEDIVKMFEDLSLDLDGDGFISPAEMNRVSPREFGYYLEDFVQRNPAKRSRLSEQVWLFPDTSDDRVFRDIQKRVAQVTKLPSILIKKSDFQVVHYGIEGHYNAHTDSSRMDRSIPCCSRHMHRTRNCRICRYMTVLFYLNDVEEGGGTAFPVAGNETLDQDLLWQMQEVNLYRNCHKSNLIVPPQRGKAILWYNHQVDSETGWLGELDEYTLHGGCPVHRGKKWISNFWIKTTDDKEEDLTEIPQF